MITLKYAFFSAAAVAAVLVPQLALAQTYYPYVQLQVLTQMQQGAPLPPSSATVTIFAPNVSLSGAQSSGGSASYATAFQNDSHTATFMPGSYSVSVTPLSGYFYSYSPGCNGVAPQSGIVSCVITASNTSSNIGTGQLVIYTNVNSYSSFGGILPSNFFLTISGNSPSPTAIPVTSNSNGASVSLEPGSYSVNAPPLAGWQVSESGDCQGYIQNGQSLTCRINYSYNASTYYGYPYNSPLACLPSYQQVAQGTNAQFTAQGGTGTYNWATAERNYQSVGAVLNAVLQESGMQTIVVSSGTQTATCMVNIVPADTMGVIGASGAGTVISSYVPSSLPNTGYEPLSFAVEQQSAAAAFALVGLLAAMVLMAPYVRRTLRILLS